MPNVLLLLPPDRESAQAIREAIELARSQKGRLFVVAALDPDALDHVVSTVTDSGFMGEKVGDSVRETLYREYRQRAAEVLERISALARAADVAVESQVEEGDPAEICSRLVPAHNIGTAILIAERRSWLTRLLARNTVQLPALAGCKVRVMEEDACDP